MQTRLASALLAADEFDGEQDQARAELEDFISMHPDMGENQQSKQQARWIAQELTVNIHRQDAVIGVTVNPWLSLPSSKHVTLT